MSACMPLREDFSVAALLDMVAVTGSIPLAPTIPTCWNDREKGASETGPFSR